MNRVYMGPKQKNDSPEGRAAMRIVEEARKKGKSVSFAAAMGVVRKRQEQKARFK